MNRLILIAFSVVLVIVSFWGIHEPANSFEWLLATNPDFRYLRLGLAIGFIMFALFPLGRDNAVQALFKLIGIALFAHAATGIISPTYWGTSEYYVFPLDLVLSIQGGIVSMLAALDMQDRREAEDYIGATLPPKFAIKLAEPEMESQQKPSPLYSQSISKA